MTVNEILTVVFLIAGFFFLMVGTVGVIRLPDFFSRMHAVGKCDTLGVLLSVIALIIYEGFSFVALKLVFVWVFLLIANPTATHVFCRAAIRSGLKPWTRTEE